MARSMPRGRTALPARACGDRARVREIRRRRPRGRGQCGHGGAVGPEAEAQSHGHAGDPAIAKRAPSSIIWRRSTSRRPKPEGRDLLVEVRAVSVNPVDYKVASGGRARRAACDADDIKVVGYDAAGVVAEVGSEARLFKPGDEVFYAGSVGRLGADMEFHLVDERIVGRKPRTLDFAAAAALPLTSITAWEAMFDRLDVAKPVLGAARAILILGGAGGVGSIAIQLARQLTDLDDRRDRVAARNRAMGEGHGRPPYRRPRKAACAAGSRRSVSIGGPALHLSRRRPWGAGVIADLASRGDRAAGARRSHQRRSRRSFRLQAEERVHPL